MKSGQETQKFGNKESFNKWSLFFDDFLSIEVKIEKMLKF